MTRTTTQIGRNVELFDLPNGTFFGALSQPLRIATASAHTVKVDKP